MNIASLLGIFLALTALPGCHGPSSTAPSATVSPPVATSPLPPAIVEVPAATAIADAGPDAPPAIASSGVFDEPVVDRRIFREVLVGALPSPPRRRTWTFTRGASRARLTIACQTGSKGAHSTGASWLRLSGEENQESQWLPAIAAEYVGEQRGTSPLSFRFSLVSGPSDRAACGVLHPAILFTCRPSKVLVLRAGAAIVVGRKGPNDEIPPHHWSPSARESVSSLRCEAEVEGDAGYASVTLWHDVAFEFAAGKHGSPGVEWAFENSDMVIQDGGYRWMP